MYLLDINPANNYPKTKELDRYITTSDIFLEDHVKQGHNLPHHFINNLKWCKIILYGRNLLKIDISGNIDWKKALDKYSIYPEEMPSLMEIYTEYCCILKEVSKRLVHQKLLYILNSRVVKGVVGGIEICTVFTLESLLALYK
jgi:hypothetical protein